MADRKTIAHQLAARVGKVPGYTVTKPRSLVGAYKVKCPDGYVIQIHMTPSDVNFDKTILRELNNHGFEDAEAKHEAGKKREAALLMEHQREEAEKKAKQLAGRAALINKAAGPYADPQEVGYEWFAEKHPAPWHRWVLMTPELAGMLIDCLNTDNRKRRPKTVDHYRQVILSGQWHLTHQGMAIDQRGILQDGQHRLEAIRLSGVTVPVSFYVGMDPANFKAIDEGLLRRAADLMTMAGAEGYAALTASTTKVIDAYESNDPRRWYHQKRTNESVHDLYRSDAERIGRAVRYGSANYKKPKLNSTGLGSAYYLICKHNGDDNPYVVAFFDGLVTGMKGTSRVMLDDDDPRTRLRDLIANWREKGKRVNALDQTGLIIMAWNFVVEDHRPRYLKLADNMEFPAVAKCAPSGRYGSAVPACLNGEVASAERQLATAS